MTLPADVRGALAEIAGEAVCRCSVEYTSRGLKDPTCNHDLAESVEVVRAELLRLARENAELHNSALGGYEDGWHALRGERDVLKAELAQYRATNENVRVCREHASEIFGDGECPVCELTRLRAGLRESSAAAKNAEWTALRAPVEGAFVRAGAGRFGGTMRRRMGLLALFVPLVLGLLYTAARYLTCLVGNPDKALNIALMVDETCNVDINGRTNEAISARAARARDAGRHWGCILCHVLDWVQPGHCSRSLKDDIRQ